ncbi:MAG: beta-lactamase family protein [Phycisphaerae bacterium]|nr:beta-lactamase family protein [Phycisphaerae bacterium]
MLGLIDARAQGLMDRFGVPGLSMACIADGELLERVFGHADAVGRWPMRAGVRFRLGSLSKPFASLLALRLVQRGLFGLDEPFLPLVRQWSLPADRAGGHDPRGVTLRRILSHLSGLGVHSFPETGTELAPTLSQILDGVDGPGCVTSIVVAPGARVEYSGAGFTVLQAGIEDLTGREYAEVLEQGVLRPLGLTGTGPHADPEDGGPAALGFDAHGRPIQFRPSRCQAASGLYSTPRDVARFFESLLPGWCGEAPGRGLVEPKLVAEMLTDQRRGAEGPCWGLGLLLHVFEGGVAYRHGGQRPGWFCHAEANTKSRCVIVAMANSSSGASCINPLVDELRCETL